MNQAIAYYRVSTVKQGASGLGLEAQKKAVSDYMASTGFSAIGEYQDIESGSKNSRPALQEALRKCRLTGATLIIAKLDRLSRDAAFLMGLQKSSIQFVCVDMPEANNFTVGLLACLAEYERQLISERTKSALQAAKARGVKLGNPNLHITGCRDTSAAIEANKRRAAARNSELREVIQDIQAEHGEGLTLEQIADHLNAANYKTARGNEFKPMTVSRIIKAA